MPKTKRRRGRPKTQSEDTVKLSLKDIENEIDDPTLFMGVLAYKKLQQTYIDKPNDLAMTLKEFEAEIDNFKKEKIYKTTPIVEETPGKDEQQTTPIEDITPTANTTEEGGS